MSLFHLLLRAFLAFLWLVSIFGFTQDENPAGVLFAVTLTLLYTLPLLYWLGIKKMKVSTVPPWDRTLTREGSLKFGRWTFAALYTIISLSILTTGRNAAAMPYMLMSMTLTLPLDRIFFAPAGSLPDIKPRWLNAWVLVFRNAGVLLCSFNAGLESEKHSLVTLTLAWSGLALIAIHPLVLIGTSKTRSLWQALIRTPEPTPGRKPGPASKIKRAIPPGPRISPIRPWAWAPNANPVKHKYRSADSHSWNWPLPPTATRYPLDEPAFFQLITGFQSSYLEAKDYHARLAAHRNPLQYNRQFLKDVKDYIQMIRSRTPLLVRQSFLGTYTTVGSVPDEISKLWLSDRHIRSLYRATQLFCTQPTKMSLMPFRAVAPQIAEYRAMINLTKWLEHSIKRAEAAQPSSAAAVVASSYKPPSPALSDERYFEIIDYIIQLGKEFENYTDLNENFNEERYRTYFLPFLNSVSPNYSAKGEVFHRKGKTDILVWDRSGTNLFIAECKIWKGEAYLLDGLTQLLTRYVNWRDEKTALIVFNRDIKDFTGVIRTATTALSNHALCRQPGRQRTDCSWSYLFHHPSDPARTIRLELILLNFV